MIIDNKDINNTWCPFNTIAFWGRTRCSFPAATKLPNKVIKPTATASDAVIKVKISFPNVGALPDKINDTIPTNADAAPPKPFSKATSCGISIIFTFLLRIIPMTEPIIKLHTIMINPNTNESLEKSNTFEYTKTKMIASNIERAESPLPIRDFLTLLIKNIPNNTATIKTREITR